METVELDRLPTWEYLQKRMTWEQLGEIKGKRVLDFGSGNGACAAPFAARRRAKGLLGRRASPIRRAAKAAPAI